MRKLYQPDTKDIQLTNVLYALSDPNRLEIIRALANTASMTCNKFELPVAKSTASHHFKVLRESGLTETQVEGTQHLIHLRRADLDARFPGLLDSVLQASQPF